MTRTITVLAALTMVAGCASPRDRIRRDIPREIREDIERLYFHNPSARSNAVCSLMSLDDEIEHAMPYLIRVLGDRSQRRRAFDERPPFDPFPDKDHEGVLADEVIEGLASWPVAWGSLLGGDEASEWVSVTAEESISALGALASAPDETDAARAGRVVARPLVAALRRRDPLVRIRVAVTLRRMKPAAVARHFPVAGGDPKQVGPALDGILRRLCLEGLTHRDPFVREEAMHVLKESPQLRTVAHLVAATRATDRRVRWQAYGELGRRLPPDSPISILGGDEGDERPTPPLKGKDAALAVSALAGALEIENRWPALGAVERLLRSPATPLPLVKRALAVERRWRPGQPRRWGRGLDSRPVPDLLALLNDPTVEAREVLIRALPLKDDERIMSDERKLSDADAGKVAAALIRELKHPSPQVRRVAAGWLTGHRTPAVRRALVAAAGDVDDDVRWTVAHALAEAERLAGTKNLIALLKTHASWRVRETAARALGALCRPVGSGNLFPDENPKPLAAPLGPVTDALIAALKDRSAAVRMAAAHALPSQSRARAVASLAAMLRSKDQNGWRTAALILGMAGREGTTVLLEALKHGDAGVQAAAVGNLPHTGDARVLPAVCNAAPTAEREAALSAVRWLSKTKGPEAADALAAALNRPDPRLRALAADALAALGDARAAPVLIEQLAGQSRGHAVSRLRELGSKAAPALGRTLGHSDPALRNSAVQLLAEMKSPLAVAALRDVMTDDGSGSGYTEIRLLERIGTPAAKEAVALGLKSRWPGTRLAAAVALAEVGDARGKSILVRRAERSWWAQTGLEKLGASAELDRIIAAEDRLEAARTAPPRVAAVEQLAELGLRGVPLAVAALRDEDAAVRKAAADTLRKLMDPRATRALIRVLRRDTDARVRAAAAAALGTGCDHGSTEWRADADCPEPCDGLLDPAAVKPLIAALADSSGRVRDAAAASLGAMGDPRAVVPLLKASSEEDPAPGSRRERLDWQDGPACVAARAIVRRLHPDARRQALLPLLSDPRPRIRTFVIHRLANDDAVVARLAHLALHDRNAAVRRAAARELDPRHTSRGRALLEAAAKDPEPVIRRRALDTAAWATDLFGRLNGSGMRGLGGRRIWVVDLYISLMDDADEDVQDRVESLLRELPLPEWDTKEDLRKWWSEASPKFSD
jgi:HEAT repeat protein